VLREECRKLFRELAALRKRVDALSTQNGTSGAGDYANALGGAELRLRMVEDVLRQRPPVTFMGVWDSTRNYIRGDVCTFSGSMWACMESNQGRRPDEPSPKARAWQLCVQRGKQGSRKRVAMGTEPLPKVLARSFALYN